MYGMIYDAKIRSVNWAMPILNQTDKKILHVGMGLLLYISIILI